MNTIKQDSEKLKNKKIILGVLKELDAADCILSQILNSHYQALVHTRFAIELLFSIDSEQANQFQTLLSQAEIADSAQKRIVKIWDTVQSHDRAHEYHESENSSINEEDVAYLTEIVRVIAERKIREFNTQMSFFNYITQAPTLMLFFLLPFLIYGVCFIYTKSLNPLNWISNSLEDFSVESASQGWGKLSLNTAATGSPLQIAGVNYEHGYGTHANSTIKLRFTKTASVFSGACGLDDAVATNGTIRCRIVAKGKELFRTPILRNRMKARPFSINIKGLKGVELIVDDAGDGIDSDLTDWVDLKLESNDNT